MTEPELPPLLPEPAKRWRKRILIALALLVSLGVAGFVLVLWLADREVQEAMAEADRLDPGWRFAELEARRAKPLLHENGAVTAQAANRLLPRTWPSPQAEKTLENLRPELRLNSVQLWYLKTEMPLTSKALTEARKLANQPTGRYAVAWGPNFFSVNMTHLQDARTTNRLLTIDAWLLAEQEELPGALLSCRAAVNAGRSLGDEPTLISMLVRIACQGSAIRTLERTLAQGEAEPADLLPIQQLLEDEAKQPLLLIAARGERGGLDQFMQAIDDGVIPATDMVSFNNIFSTGPNANYEFLLPAARRRLRAGALRYQNGFVEVAKLPAERQKQAFEKLSAQVDELPVTARMLIPAYEKCVSAYQRSQALLRSSSAALAAERFRLEQGRWPESLAELCPTYLPQVPSDPFDGHPLRYRKLDDGVVFYSVGPDGKDDGGKFDRQNAIAPGTDVGFQLWNPDQRRQAGIEPPMGPPKPGQ